MVWMKTTRKVLKGRGSWSNLNVLINYKRNPNHFIDEHVDHVVNMIKRLESGIFFSPSYKKRFLQLSLIELEVKILEHIWEFFQEKPQGLANKSFDDLVDLFKEHSQIRFVKNVTKQMTMFSISPNLRSASFLNSIKYENIRGLWLMKTTSRVIENTIYNPNIV